MITENTLHLLEFHKLLGRISSYSHCEASEKAVLAILPLSVKSDIDKRLGQIAEIRRMASEGDPLKISRFPDISPLMVRLRPEGSFLESRELAGFIPFLSVVSDISSQTAEKTSLPLLRELGSQLTGFPDILSLLKRSIDGDGNILDSASSALSELRGQVRRLEGRIRKNLEDIMRDERIALFLQDDFITQRSGRWVIPVRMDSKGQVPGVVHDVSRSGETAFTEPLTIISLSNELENLIAEQKAEEIRILRNICSRLRAVAGEMDHEHKVTVYLDLLNCIAQFADQLRMEPPRTEDSAMIHLVGARHPLLSLSFEKSGIGRQVVPLDVHLGGDSTVMVITGSNAGGKTIAIKTIGLLQLMALSGMPIPADSSSRLPIVRDVLIDIGDEQSIENSLSTFSAHVSNISGILKKADGRSLVLIDELGTGTDPDEGAALACAVLKEIRSSGALLFATTHLTDIKGFVHRTEGMINASMEFDQKTLSPLYRLRSGEPGQSHALEIAKRYGLPASIIDSAREMLGGIRVEFDNLLADLQARRAEYEGGLAVLREKQARAEEDNRRLQVLLSETESRQREVIERAYREAADILAATKREMHALIEEVRKKERAESRKALKKVQARQEEIDHKLREYDVSRGAVPSIDDMKEGDIVFVRSLGFDTTIREVNRKYNRLRVFSGGMEIEVPLSDVAFGRGKPREVRAAARIDRTDEAVQSRINLVGLRVGEALSLLEPFLNHASLSGLSEVTIIHGLGTGALAKAVREHLEQHPLVETFRKGEPAEGGAGVTVAKMA